MNPTAHIETSVVSQLSARPSQDVVVAAYQEVTRERWRDAAATFHFVASKLVLAECRAGDRSAAHARLKALEGVALVDASPDAEDLARRLLDPGAVPREAAADAAHIAIAVTNGVEYLVTWNFRHIANAAMRVRIERACRDWSDKRETARRVKQRISARRWLIPQETKWNAPTHAAACSRSGGS